MSTTSASEIAHLYLAGHNVWGRGGTWCAAASAATSPVRQNGRHPFFGNPLIPPGPPLTTTEFRILKPSAIGLPALLMWCVKDAKAGECEVEPRKGGSSRTISLSSSEVWSLMYWSHAKNLAEVLILKSPFQICDIQTLEYSINQSLAECKATQDSSVSQRQSSILKKNSIWAEESEPAGRKMPTSILNWTR